MLPRSNIPTSPRNCLECGRAFENAEPIRSALVTEKDGKWSRLSWCEACWPGPKSEFLTWWRASFSKRPERRPIPDDALPDLFERVLADSSLARLATLLAWHLVRRKCMVYLDKETTPSGSFLKFRVISTSQEFELPDAAPDVEDRESFRKLVELIDPSYSP